MKEFYIYFHINPQTNEIFYVGMGILYRYKEIKYNRNKHYFNYIKKYGKPIIKKIHENLTFEEACELEIKYIKQFGRKGYEKNGILVNKSLGGEIGAKGIKHTDEWKQNHSIIMKQISNTKKFKQITSNTHKNKIVTNETKEKISNSLKPLKQQRSKNIKTTLNKSEVKEKRSKAISEGRKKPIQQLDINNNIINTFNSVNEASKTTGIKGISNVTSGRSKSAGGFFWQYINK